MQMYLNEIGFLSLCVLPSHDVSVCVFEWNVRFDYQTKKINTHEKSNELIQIQQQHQTIIHKSQYVWRIFSYSVWQAMIYRVPIICP